MRLVSLRTSLAEQAEQALPQPGANRRTGKTLRQASEDLPDDHLRGALQHAPADRSDLAADGSVVDVFEAGVAVVQFYEAHPRTAGGRAHRAVAGAGQLQRVRRVEV